MYGLSYQPMKDKRYDRFKSKGRPLTSEAVHETLVLRFGPSLFAYTKYNLARISRIMYRNFPQYVSTKYWLTAYM